MGGRCGNCEHWRIELELAEDGVCLKGPGPTMLKVDPPIEGLSWLKTQDVYLLTRPNASCSNWKEKK